MSGDDPPVPRQPPSPPSSPTQPKDEADKESKDENLRLPKQRLLARKTLVAVGINTSKLLKRGRKAGGVMKFGIDTMAALVSPAVPFTVDKWSTYGEPLLSCLDRKIDQAVSALENVTAPLQPKSGPIAIQPPAIASSPDSKAPGSPEDNKQAYCLYWEKLKQKFMSSQWFIKCNQILMQNKMVQAVTEKVVQPAEVFYNTVTEEFVAQKDLDQYLLSLRTRMGLAWDDRLCPLARAFYTTAHSVSKIVGAGWFMGGAIQLGKSKIHTAIDDLLTRWDRVLGITDDMVHQYLPEGGRGAELKGEPDGDVEGDGEGEEGEEEGGASEAEAEAPVESKSNEDEESEEEVHQSEIDEVSEEHVEQGIFSMEEDLADGEGEENSGAGGGGGGGGAQDVASSPIKESGGRSGGSARGAGGRSSARRRKKRSRRGSERYCREIEGEQQNESSSEAPTSPSRPSPKPSSPKPSPKPSKRGRNSLLIGLSSNFVSQLRETLLRHDYNWFNNVDLILKQSPLARAMAVIMRPADHFYQTSIEIFRQQPLTLEKFLDHLRTKLGGNWDDRLLDYSSLFFKVASLTLLNNSNGGEPKQHSSSSSSIDSGSVAIRLSNPEEDNNL